ncbi:GntR family transcriptional regulator [Spirochaeta dissipatitropha]
MSPSDRQSKETAREYALRMIKNSIINLELAPGSMVSENELAARFGLSRTPVREAMIELGKAQIMEIFPQKGSRVSLIDYDLVEEASFLRRVLETAVAEKLCSLAGSLDFSHVHEILRLQVFYVDHPSPAKFFSLDNQFHAELFRLCGKSRIHSLIDSMTTHFDRVRTMSLLTISGDRIVKDHYSIIEAIENKDAAAARDAMTEHLSRYKIDENLLREKYPDYFKPLGTV